MTQDELIAMATVAYDRCSHIPNLKIPKEFIDCFAKLVAEKATEEANARANASWALMCEKMVAFEREACAKLLEDWNKHAWNPFDCAVAIRARGQQ